MNADHCLGTWGQYSADGFSRYVLLVTVYFSKYRDSPSIDDTRHRSQECAWRDNHLITCTNAQCQQRHIQRYRAIGQRDGMLGASPCSKFFLELTTLLPRPVIDLVGKN